MFKNRKVPVLALLTLASLAAFVFFVMSPLLFLWPSWVPLLCLIPPVVFVTKVVFFEKPMKGAELKKHERFLNELSEINEEVETSGRSSSSWNPPKEKPSP